MAALQDVNLKVNEGEVLAFLGPNGAGKTTTIKILTGLITPDNGTVSINGKDPSKDASSLRSIGAVLEGNRNLYWRLTPEENIEYFGVLKGLKRRDAIQNGKELLDRFGLSEKKKVAVQTLSRGMQQKVAIVVSLVHRPNLLLLDEPTLGLDVESAQEVKKLVSELVTDGHAVLLTTHQLEVAEELSDRVTIIRNGKIIIEESTEKVIKQFSGEAYVITMEESLNPERIQALQKLGAVVDNERVIMRQKKSEGLYELLNVIAPLPFVKIEKDQANLTDIFLRLIKEKSDV